MPAVKPVYEYQFQCHQDYRWTLDVLIFRSSKDLDTWRRRIGLKKPCEAYFVAGSNLVRGKHGKMVRGNYIGEVGFTVPWFRVGIIAHESLHAALAFMRHIRKPVRRNEEFLAWVVGEIARQIIGGHYVARKHRRAKKVRKSRMRKSRPSGQDLSDLDQRYPK